MGNAKLNVALTAILLIFAALPALIAGTAGMITVGSYENDVKTDTLSAVSLSKSTAIDRIFLSYTTGVSALAKSKAVIEAAENGGEGAEDYIKAVTGNNPDYIDILLIDEKGSVLYSAADSTSGSFEYFESDGLPSVSCIMNWESYGRTNAFFISREIYADPDTKTGGKLGYVCAVISLASDSGVIKALQGEFLDGGHMVLMDMNCNAVNFANDGAVMKSAQLDQSFVTVAGEDVFGKTGPVSDGNSYNTMYSGRAGRYAYSSGIIPNITSWRWLGIVDAGTLGSFSGGVNIIGWGLIIVSVALASVAAVIIVSRYVGNMHDMLDTMDQIAAFEDDNNIRFKVKDKNSELGEIQTSFNELLDEVILSEVRHRTIAELSDSMLFEWDFHRKSMYVSDNTLEKFNIDALGATLLNGHFISSLMGEKDSERYMRDMTELIKNKNSYSAEYRLRTRNDSVIWVSLRAVCITDRLGETLRVIGVMTDIDNEKKLEIQLSERASFDFLSQLYNRSTFIRNLKAEIERLGAKRLAVLFIDVDDFKHINDKYGHSAGDEVIKYVADTIKKKVENGHGFAGRFGGDEFVICFTNQNDIENIKEVSMGILNELSRGYEISDKSDIIYVKASIGVALCPDHSSEINTLLSYADTAMYFVKKNGKTNYHVYAPEDSYTKEYADPEGF